MQPVKKVVEVETFELSRAEMEVIFTIVGNANIPETIKNAKANGQKLSDSDIMKAHGDLKKALS